MAVHQVNLVEGIGEHALEVHLVVAVGTCLLLAHNAPASDAKLVKLVTTGQTECVLQDPLLTHSNKQLVATN